MAKPPKKPVEDHSLQFRIPWFLEGRATGHGIYVLAALIIILFGVRWFF